MRWRCGFANKRCARLVRNRVLFLLQCARVGRRRTREPTSAFGKFLLVHLEQQGLEAAEFAERAGLSVSHVYQLLRGDRSEPRGKTFSKVAAALGMSEAQLARATQGDRDLPDNVQVVGTLSVEEAVDKSTFFAIMSAFPTGVTIVTTLDADAQPIGLTCSALCSLSAEPPLVLVCIDRRSSVLPALRQSGRFVVNYLLAGRDELSNRFASREQERWTGVPWRPTRHGLPWLHRDSLAYAECALVREFEGGDHVVLFGCVDGGQPPAPATRPLMYFRRSYATWPH